MKDFFLENNQMHPKYNEDFYEWTTHTVDLLKNRKMDEVDYDNIIEEIESLGRSEKRQLTRCFTELITHLLMWQYEPQLRTRSRSGAIAFERINIEATLEDSPSLKAKIPEVISTSFLRSKALIKRDTEIDLKVLPKECAYSFEELLEEEFYPEG